ncbi:nucleoside-diphosphate kinase [Candidatus Margulisiibacteriota bacterium]
MSSERTFFMVKPDGVKRYLSNLALSKMVNSGLKIVVRRRLNMTGEQAEKLYAVHKGKPFYEGLLKYITSGPVIISVLEGENAVSNVREMMGATDPGKAAPGTIRGDNKEDNILTEDGIIKNICHGSDSAENAKYEMSVFFKEEDLKTK